MPSRVSLAELIDSDIPVRPDEAVAILREVCRQYAGGDLRGIPNPTVIRLTGDGAVAVEGPVSRDQDAIRAAAGLLGELLPGFHTPTGFKVPGGLRLVLARAMRTIDLPPFADVNEFSAALARFAAPDLGETVRSLFRSWSARRAVESAADRPHELTVSDIRRARRATRVSLDEIARTTGIPAWRLRELEWGYLRNWSPDDAGREELRRYARAAGLDETTVLSVAWPMVEAATADPTDEPQPAPPAESSALVPAPVDPAPPLPWRAKPAALARLSDRHRRAVALIAAVLIAVAAVIFGWDRPASTTVAALESAPAPVESVRQPEAAHRANAVAPAKVAPARVSPAKKDTQRVSYVQPAAHPSTKRKPKSTPQKKSFFKRELFRIEIR
jgi:hypothetical protein